MVGRSDLLPDMAHEDVHTSVATVASMTCALHQRRPCLPARLGRAHYLSTFLPAGTYVVSRTLECIQLEKLFYTTATEPNCNNMIETFGATPKLQPHCGRTAPYVLQGTTAASGDGRLLYSCGYWDHSLKVTQLADGRSLQSVRAHTDVVTCVVCEHGWRVQIEAHDLVKRSEAEEHVVVVRDLEELAQSFARSLAAPLLEAYIAAAAAGPWEGGALLLRSTSSRDSTAPRIDAWWMPGRPGPLHPGEGVEQACCI